VKQNIGEMSRRGYSGGGGSGGGRPMASVFVRNLHHDCRPEELRKLFQKYGDISDVYIPLDYYTRESRGFAYVQFDHKEDAEDAVHYLDGYKLFGRAIEVQVAQGDRKTPAQMRYRGGGQRRRRSYSRSRSRSRSPRRAGGGGYRGRRSRTRSRSRSRSPPQQRRSRSGSSHKRAVSRSRTRSKSNSR